MSHKKQLGIYFGSQSLSIVLSENQVPEKFITAPYGIFENQSYKSDIPPNEITLAAVTQKSLRDQKITTTGVHLSVPAKDIISRSFIMPWMQTSELRRAIEFESRKYIPFSIEDLHYTYHSTNLMDNDVKKVQVLFTAIKKESLQKYIDVFDQSNLHVISIEPSSMSLVRTLTLRNQIPQNQTVALVQLEEDGGKITIIDHGVPNFVRDFPLRSPSDQTDELKPELLSIRLFNEIRNSLNYYQRQHKQQKIDGIITLSANESADLLENLGKELNIPTVALNANTVFGTSSLVDIDILYAFGSSLHYSVPLPAKLNLSPEPINAFQFSKDAIDFRALMKTAAICFFILVITFVFANRLALGYRKTILQLKQKQGSYQSFALADLEAKTKEVLRKFENYKTSPINSNVAQFLEILPTLLPEGGWLNDLNISYQDRSSPNAKTASIHLDGYMFRQDVKQQIRFVNKFVENLKNHKDFSQYFKRIELVSAKTQDLQDNVVTYFRIACK